ncbi:MAG: aminomethyl-transferring glycine dehydrogenase subunit GcvPB [bacterium]
MNYEYRNVFEIPPGRGFEAGAADTPEVDLAAFYADEFVRDDFGPMRDVATSEVVRHYTRLAAMNFGVDTGFYPLGSCTMKYNPKVNEDAAALPGFAALHPYAPARDVQGALQLISELERYLVEICGMSAFTLAPAAGAHGELVGMLLTRAYHRKRGDDGRNVMMIPDSAHGTNPASARMAGFDVVAVASSADGVIDLDDLRTKLDESVAGMMITNPNTLGLFEPDILKVADAVHGAGGLLYYDGANLNAVVGRARPGDMGFDVCHVNLHKTFSTPHGGGGPGACPVGVCDKLVDFLPVPRVVKKRGKYGLDYGAPDSIGQIRSFVGNFGVLVRAYAYIRHLGAAGLRDVSGAAVLNANYLRAKVARFIEVAGSAPCMHEFVASSAKFGRGSAGDIDKALIDVGFHPPTTYFPLVVPEALMIEPTETETKETLDEFAAALEKIVTDLTADAHAYADAPLKAPVRRFDEAAAARNPILTQMMAEEKGGVKRP